MWMSRVPRAYLGHERSEAARGAPVRKGAGHVRVERARVHDGRRRAVLDRQYRQQRAVDARRALAVPETRLHGAWTGTRRGTLYTDLTRLSG